MSDVQKSDKTVTAGAVRAEEGAVERTAGDATAAQADPAAPMRFGTKVVVVLSDDLAAWQELNVTAFLMSGIATSAPDLVGEPYRDADGVEYLPMLREPVMVMSGTGELLARARSKASARTDVALALYTRELFETGHDAANRAQVVGVASADLDLVGIAVRGPRNAVDRIVKGARFRA